MLPNLGKSTEPPPWMRLAGGGLLDTPRFASLCVVALLASFLYGATASATDYPEVADNCHLLFPNEPGCRWSHKHLNYPTRPYQLDEINRVFGYVNPDTDPPTCQERHRGNFMKWKSADHDNNDPIWPSDDRWSVYFHNKLGGTGSSNLDWDVKGHYKHDGWMPKLLGGIFGYHCRFKTGSTYRASTHSWGIAVDINARQEHYGHTHACHTVTKGMANVWSNHKWYWGANFKGNSKDCMHFQYARGY